MICFTLSDVSELILGWLEITRETVEGDTPANLAISLIVIM